MSAIWDILNNRGMTGDQLVRYEPGSGKGWLGTGFQIDTGATEAVQGIVAPKQAYASSGGSNLFPDSPQATGGNVLGDTSNQNVTDAVPQDTSGINTGGSGGSGGTSVNLGDGSGGDGGSGSTDTGPTAEQQAFLKELNSAYSGAIDPLLQARQSLQDFRPGFINDIRNQFGQQVTRQQSNLTNQLNNLGQQRTQSEGIAQNALGDARRVYNELMQANQARFGGGSAGQFAGEILGRTTANQFGQVNQGLSNQMHQIASEENRVKEETANNISAIEQQRDQAVRNAEFELQSRLQQINEQISAREVDKANARLQALQDFRNQAIAIKNNADQLRQQQVMNAQQILAQLAGQGLVGAEDLMQGFGFNQPGMQVQQQAGTAQTPQQNLRFLPGQQDEQMQAIGAGAIQ